MKSMERGLTLIELLVVLVLMGFLASVGAVSWQRFWINQLMSGAATELAASLTLARAEAVHGRQEVLVEPLDPGLGWVSGWHVHAGAQEFSRSPPLSPRLVQDSRTTGSFKNSTKGGAFFAFSAKGFSQRISSRFNAMPTGKLWWSSPDTPQERVVLVDWVGRVRLCDPLLDKKHCGD